MIVVFRVERVLRQKTNMAESYKSNKSDWQRIHENLEKFQISYKEQLFKFIEDLEPIPMQESWVENIIQVYTIFKHT